MQDITESIKQTEPTGTVTFQVREFGKWALGYAWLDVTLGGTGPVTGLALYVKQKGQKKATRVVFSLKEAVGFLADQKVPSKQAAKVLHTCDIEGGFGREK